MLSDTRPREFDNTLRNKASSSRSNPIAIGNPAVQFL